MTSSDRLRQHPEDRLSPSVQIVKLAEVAAKLRAEAHGSVSGHRQIAISRHGPVTNILFGLSELGLLLASGAWARVATSLYVETDPSVPLLSLVLLAASAVVLANLVAVVPAWLAARQRPAPALHSE